MPTYRLLIEYEGTRYAGWQVQAGARTVQGELLGALRGVLGEDGIDLQGAGRTDAGVHALGQVASLRCRRPVAPELLVEGLAGTLPHDIAVVSAELAPRGFHARHDAVERAYLYQIALRRSAFGKRFTWWVREPLDAAAMSRAAAGFVGRHDFAPFTRRAGEQRSTVVEVTACDVFEFDEVVLIRVRASHFVWRQVRRMVGSLVSVGRREAKPGDVASWLSGAAAPPALAAPSAGLFLEAVGYPGEPWPPQPPFPVAVPVHAGPVRSTMGPAGGVNGV